MRHLLNPLDFSVEEIDDLLALARDIESNLPKYAYVCDGKKLATLFYEPSTRTRLSFEAAMLNLGGNVLGFSSANSSSASKGESVADTIRMISCYADICAMRHPKEGAAYVAAQKARIPVINAGDGGHQHPTQTLTDLMTIRSLKGRLDNLTIGLCGDLKFGRTVHSLINAMVRYPGVKFVLISPPELRIPDSIREDVLIANNIPFEEIGSLDDSIGTLDILYMTRVQKERFFNEEDYVRMKDFYILDKAKLELAKEVMYILHPLPRVNEIAVEVDSDPRAAYLLDLGFTLPESVQKLAGESNDFSITVSREIADQLDDIEMMVVYGDENLVETLQEDKLMSQIPAIKNGAVVVLDSTSALAASSTPSILSIPYEIDDYLEMFAKAAENIK